MRRVLTVLAALATFAAVFVAAPAEAVDYEAFTGPNGCRMQLEIERNPFGYSRYTGHSWGNNSAPPCSGEFGVVAVRHCGISHSAGVVHLIDSSSRWSTGWVWGQCGSNDRVVGWVRANGRNYVTMLSAAPGY